MKKYLIIFITSLLVSWPAFSQHKETIIDELEKTATGEGSVAVETDDSITALLGTPNKHVALEDDDYVMGKTSGYRLLAYMGSDQRKSRGEASGRQGLVKEKFSDVGTYLVYDAPNWKLLVGDFVSRDEANAFRQMLQKEFPDFGKEVYIVNDIVNVPIIK